MKHLREPINALTHLIAAACAVPAMIYLLVISSWPRETLGFLFFGLSMILLYLASGLYHGIKCSEKTERVLRKLDHSMICILIAGTYTPICIIPLWGAWGITLLIIIWVLAVGGILLKVIWIDAPRWLGTAVYLLMGWICVIAVYPMFQTMSLFSLGWLLAGGIFYTVGAVIYGRKKTIFHFKNWGFHEIFHLFIIAGTVCHYIVMLSLR